MGPDHGPEVGAARDVLEAFEFAIIILIIILSERDDVALHFGLFFSESLHDMAVFQGRHWQIEYIDMIMIDDRYAILHIPGFRGVRDEFKIGV
jgi:hypothetical protein